MAKNNEFVVQAYEFPAGLNNHVLTGIAFTPMQARRHLKQVPPAPDEVRWGMATCLRKDFAELLGRALSENVVVGQLRLENGTMVKHWVPVIFKNQISIPNGKPDNAPATAKYLDGKAIYDSDKYLIILRSDVYEVVKGFHFEGCKVTRAEVPLVKSGPRVAAKKPKRDTA